MSREKLVQLLDQVTDLPTLPTVYVKVNALLQSSGANAAQVARIVESDQAIATKVLRLVNSSFFGLSRRVTQISQAIVLLGFNAIRSVVLSISVFESFKGGGSNKRFDRRDFWKHAIATGSIARMLAKELRIGAEEDAFSGGILHDIGKLVLDQVLPGEFEKILTFVDEKGCSMFEAEHRVLGTDHCEIGEYLLEKWNLPPLLIECVALHHSPAIFRSNPQMVSIIHLADIFARRLHIGSGGDNLIPTPDPFALEELELDQDAFLAQEDNVRAVLEQSQDMLALVN